MDNILKNVANSRRMLNTAYLNVPLQCVGFTSCLTGILMQRGLGMQTAASFFEDIQHLYSIKKQITIDDYRLILEAVNNKPLQWKAIQDKVLIPIAAKQRINIKDTLDRIVSGDVDSDVTVQLDEEIVELMNEVNKQVQEEKRKKQQEEKQSLLYIEKLQKEEMALRQRSDAEGQDCQICMSGLYQQNAEPFPLQKCGHVFHTLCIQSCLNALISQRKFPLICPNDGCKQQLVQRDISSILSAQSAQKYHQFTFKNYLDMNSDTVSWCPTAGCKYVFFFSSEDRQRFQCTECKKQYCLICKVAWHRDMTCKEFQISNNFSAEDEKFMKFVTGQHYKQCPKCKFFVEKTMVDVEQFRDVIIWCADANTSSVISVEASMGIVSVQGKIREEWNKEGQ